MIHILLAVVCIGGSNPTNLDLAEVTVEQACILLADTLNQYGIESVQIETEGDHEGNWLVEQTAAAVISNSGITVLTERNPIGGNVLMIRPMDLAVKYGDTCRSWFLGRKNVRRIAVCELSSTLIDEQGSIVLTVRSGAENNDIVPVSDIGVLSGVDEWRWLSPEGIEEDEGGGILEPLVVTGVVASLIYLFYSSRAD